MFAPALTFPLKMKTKLFALPLIAVLVLAAGCQKYDDTALREQIQAQEQRIAALEIAINALKSNDYVENVIPITEDGVIVGYTIVFAQSGQITVMNGKDGQNGKDGKDGQNGKDGKDGYSVQVLEDEVIFTIEGGTTFSIPRYAADHFDLPTSMILTTDVISDVIKKDTVRLDIIVNPSDFPLTKDNLTLLVQNKIFTKFDRKFDEEHPDGIETPFDETAHCDFTITEVYQNEQYEGAYSIAVAVGGEGNFFNDANAYVLAAAKDHSGKVHYTCSNTPVTIHVIPWIEEGLVLDCPNQSFYAMDEGLHATDSLKAHYATLWSNSYKSAADEYRVYDRAKINSVSIAEESQLATCEAIDCSKFQDEGLLMLNPDTKSEFWTNAIAAYQTDGTAAVSVEDAGLFVVRGSEAKTLPFNFKTFFSIETKYDLVLKSSELKANGNKFTKDLTADFAAAGDDATFPSSTIYKLSESMNTGVTGGKCVADVKDNTLEMMFYNINPTTEPFNIVSIIIKELESYQNPDGTFSVKRPAYRILNHRVDAKVSIIDE